MRYSDGSEKRAAAWAVVINPAFERPELGEFVLAVSIEGEVTEFELPRVTEFDLHLTETMLSPVVGYNGIAVLVGLLTGTGRYGTAVLIEADTSTGNIRTVRETNTIDWEGLVQEIAPLAKDTERLCEARQKSVDRLVEDLGGSCSR